MANRVVAKLSADDYDDVESVVDRLRGAFEKRFGVSTMVEATYPNWVVLASLSPRDPAPETAAAWARDWLFDLDPSMAVSRGLSTPRPRRLSGGRHRVAKSPAQLDREVEAALRGDHGSEPLTRSISPPRRVEILDAGDSRYFKRGQFGYAQWENRLGGTHTLDSGVSRAGQTVYAVSKSKSGAGGALWFTADALRFTGR